MKLRPKAVVFDLDDTLVDSPLDLSQVCRELGLPDNTFLIEHITSLECSLEKEKCWAVIHRHEKHAAESCILMPGALDFLEALAKKQTPIGIWTRNSSETVSTILKRFSLRTTAVVDRSFPKPKPNIASIEYFQDIWKLQPKDILLIDDQPFAISAAKQAGLATALFVSHKNPEVTCPHADQVINAFSTLYPLFLEECQ